MSPAQSAVVLLLTMGALLLSGCGTEVTALDDSGAEPATAALALVREPDLRPPVALPRPDLGDAYVDPVFGTEVHRVTDGPQAADRNTPDWIRHWYSRKQAFNADSTRALMVSSNGWLRVYGIDGADVSFERTIDGGEDVVWHPTDPNLVYAFGEADGDILIRTIDVRDDSVVRTRDLSDRLAALFGPTAARAWTRHEGSPSTDGRTWCFQVETNDGGMLGLISYSLDDDRILGHLRTTDRPDHVSTSPDGGRCVPSWESELGTRAYTTDFSDYTQLHTTSEHSDVAVDRDGREVIVFADYQTGHLAMVDLESGDRVNLFGMYGPRSSATSLHVSGRADLMPGWVLVSFYGCTERNGAEPCTPGGQWFDDKIVAVELAPEPTVLGIAHNHYGDGGYWTEPHATVNRDFTKVLFASTWRATNQDDLAAYLVDLPEGSLAGD